MIIEILVISAFVVCATLFTLVTGRQRVKKVLYEMFGFVALIAATGMALAYLPLSNGSVVTVSIPSNSVLQNTNSSPLYIYATTEGTLQGWLGPNTGNMMLVADDASVLFGTGVSLQYNDTTLIAVPEGFWYKFNYTGPAKFIEVSNP